MISTNTMFGGTVSLKSGIFYASLWMRCIHWEQALHQE